MLEIKVDSQIEGQLAEMARLVPVAVTAGLMAVGKREQQIAVREISKIKARPIPRRKNGKAMWKRSGRLLASVKAPLIARGNNLSLAPKVAYAGRRQGLGVAWTPRKPALGIIRKNEFLVDTQKALGPMAAPIFEKAFGEKLDR